MTFADGSWSVDSTLDIVRVAAQTRRAAERLGADALRQSSIFEAVLETAAALRPRCRAIRVELAADAHDGRQSTLRVRIVGRLPHPPDASPDQETSSEWAHRWLKAMQRALNPEIVAATDEEIVLAIETRFDLIDAQIEKSESNASPTQDAVPPAEQGILDELRHANSTLRAALIEADLKRDELSRLSRELDETNRGVVALYAELDERADELRRADHAKTRFLSNVSHELRTPLNSIRALAGLLLDRLDGPLTEEQSKQVTFIHTAAGELRQTVDDLLDIAKIAAGGSEVQHQPFEIEELFGALRGTLKPLLSGNGVALHFDAAARLPTMVSDERKIAQILRNLVSNALKFTESGEVRVRAEVADDARTVRFEVSDTGIGIAPDDHDRIFEEFFQIANPLQVNATGTGLGLPLCRRLATLLGGTIEVESVPGEGSCFRVVLPRFFEGHSEPNAPDMPPDGGAKANPCSTQEPQTLRILLIDDDPAARYAVRRRLEGNSVSIVETDTGSSGLDAVSTSAPHLVVLDLQLPDVHGLEVLRLLRALPQAQEIPVAVLTSLDLDNAAHSELQDSLVTVLSKKDIGAADFCQRLLSIAAPAQGARRS